METNILDILSKYPSGQRDFLIQILQEIQDELGYLSENSVTNVGKHLNLPTSKIYGLATFYNQFRFEPRGKFHVQLCNGTACHMEGAVTVLSRLEKELKIKPGQITRDGLFSIEVMTCIGACGQAPVISVNGEYHTHMNWERLKRLIQKLRNQED